MQSEPADLAHSRGSGKSDRRVVERTPRESEGHGYAAFGQSGSDAEDLTYGEKNISLVKLGGAPLFRPPPIATVDELSESSAQRIINFKKPSL